MYLLDSNVLIEAKNRYYAFDIAPGFWAWLDHAHAQGPACSIEAVRDELLAGNDELAEWARQHPDFFRALDQGTTRHFGPLTAWAGSRDFTPAAIAAFTGSAADYLLVAYARSTSTFSSLTNALTRTPRLESSYRTPVSLLASSTPIPSRCSAKPVRTWIYDRTRNIDQPRYQLHRQFGAASDAS